MVGGEAALEIRVLHRHGKRIREIARETGSSRNTVRRYWRDESAGRYKPRPPRARKLDPFKDYVVERLTSAAPERIPASVLRDLRATKGKVERFIGYLRESFWVPLSRRLAQEGLIVDRESANLAVKRWLRDVANARLHGTTGAIPSERLVSERLQLQPVPTPYGGGTVRALQARPEPAAIIGMQHPLSLYDAFAGGLR